MITSTSNPCVKELVLLGKKAKERKTQGVFLAEGIKMFSEAPREWIRQVYVSESFLWEEANQGLLAGVEYETLADHVFEAASGTQSPQGILAVLKRPKWDMEVLCKQTKGLYLFLEKIQDPGNLGTILRTAESAGVTAVIASPSTVDLYNPKTVRSTMGSIFRMPFFVPEDFPDAIRQFQADGVRCYAASLKGSVPYDSLDYRQKSAFLIGNESQGLSEAITLLANARIHIPMEGQAESLNAAVAAAILMYEANRQRRG